MNRRYLVKHENTQSLSLQIEAGTFSSDNSVSIKEITGRHVPKTSDFINIATRISNPVHLTSNFFAIIDKTLEKGLRNFVRWQTINMTKNVYLLIELQTILKHGGFVVYMEALLDKHKALHVRTPEIEQ